MMTTSNDQPKQPTQPEKCPQCALPTHPETPFCERCNFDLRYGTKPVKRGKCIYCENTRDFAREHIFPDWLAKIFPKRHRKRLHVLGRPERIAFWEEIKVIENDSVAQGDPYDTVVYNVCGDCNNGWMSTLQAQAKTLVESLAKGMFWILSEADNNLLCRWVTMVSINLQCHARMLVAPQWQRTALMNGLMPDGWRISVGRMTNVGSAGSSFCTTASVPIGLGEGEFLKITSTAFVIERAIFHSFSSMGNQTLDVALLGAGLGESAFTIRPVWPLPAQPVDEPGRDISSIDQLYRLLRRADDTPIPDEELDPEAGTSLESAEGATGHVVYGISKDAKEVTFGIQKIDGGFATFRMEMNGFTWAIQRLREAASKETLLLQCLDPNERGVEVLDISEGTATIGPDGTGILLLEAQAFRIAIPLGPAFVNYLRDRLDEVARALASDSQDAIDSPAPS
ncbi:hypothetical protein MKK63_22815 [Methylobacterium sp. J-088]|uniref:hypothetical protein n=1 Tax=Methylobacterium sp. J-088 TaxID=2836664 RepID=UPI001FBB2B59|nr:hypothetical protein [Methylobacterium sp. J-088]MCJ2065518.1 hypothetical protein [Methylobacterium sp. J-088]